MTPLRIIVSRHPAAAEFLRAECPEFANAEVLASATAKDVRGKVVGGNLPMHLASVAAEMVAVEFDGPPPRGKELSLEDMRAAGARVRRYRVLPVPQAEESPEIEVAAQPSSNSPYADWLRILAPAETQFPARGDWIDRGKVGSSRVWAFSPDPNGPLCAVVHGKIAHDPDSGWIRIAGKEGTGSALTIGFAREGARLETAVGYKGRQTQIVEVREGRLAHLDDAEAAPTTGGQSASTSFADKLRDAGVI